MLSRALPLCAALVAAVLCCTAATAQDKKPGGRAANSHEGWFVSAKDGKIVMKGQAAKNEHPHTLAPAVKVTCDGKSCHVSALKKGTHIKVPMRKEGEHNVVSPIDALTRIKAPGGGGKTPGGIR